MQTLSRAIRRGNAHIVVPMSTKVPTIIYKKGSTRKEWHYAEKNASEEQELKFTKKLNDQLKKI